MADILGVPEVAELFGVHIETVREWLRSGRLPGVHVGRRWFVRRDDVDRMFAKGGYFGKSYKEVGAAGAAGVAGTKGGQGSAADAGGAAADAKQVKRGRKRR